jgi:hypothetical protein
MRPAIITILFCGLLGCSNSGSGSGARPIPFAHNDYAHARPLFDALDHGYGGVEADIFLVDGQLLVGHETKELTPQRTLQWLYLDPLKKLVEQKDRRLPKHRPFMLMIDVKSDADPTYAALRDVLAQYRPLLTISADDRVSPGAITVILSGNRAKQAVAAEPVRLVGIDGRLEDLPINPPKNLVPWISAPWDRNFTWRGQGEFPPAEKARLRDWVQQAHAQGRMIRFWATPETPNAWRELRDAGVDLINTDDLPALASFLTQ